MPHSPDIPRVQHGGPSAIARHPVVIVGAGPVGLCCAIDLAQRGVPVLVITDHEHADTGSRAVCYAKRSLEILDRLGVGDAVVERGLAWDTGRVYLRDRQVYTYHLQPESGHERPAFINLQQYHLERLLLARAQALPNLVILRRHRLAGLLAADGGVRLSVATPDAQLTLDADWLLACDGARSTVRRLSGAGTDEASAEGTSYRDRFLIADVLVDACLPAERRFWFDPPFHPGRSALMHKQPDGLWRVELQLGWDGANGDALQPESLLPQINAMFGSDAHCVLQSVSVYTVACRRMARFRHGRIMFAGDAAHQVSPFGARGSNSGMQDADNLGWKLKLVLDGAAPDTLLDSYSDERVQAAQENIDSDRQTLDFIAPASAASAQLRDAALSLAAEYGFARRLVNAGRLATPCIYRSTLNTPDGDCFAGTMVPGAPAADAPVTVAGKADWLLRHVGEHFCGLYFCGNGLSKKDAAQLAELAGDAVGVTPLIVATPGSRLAGMPGLRVLRDIHGVLAQRYDGAPGTFYLLRPDQHVAARWRAFDPGRVREALLRATANA